MRKHYKNEVCYFCGAPATSKEHVPPKLMFRGFSCDRITVPSCDAHNMGKSGEDQAILSGLLIPLDNGVREHSWKLEADVAKALNVGKSSFVRAKRKAFSSSILNNPPGKLSDVSYMAFDTQAWIRQLTAALVFDGIEGFDPTIDWENAPMWSKEWYPAPNQATFTTEDFIEIAQARQEMKAEAESFNWRDGWSATPRPYPSDIYRFWLYVDNPSEVAFKHTFYNRYTWYVVFIASSETREELAEKIALKPNSEK